MLSTHDPSELRHIGNRLLAQRKPAEALSVFEQLARLHPEDPRGFDGIARVLRDLDRNEELLARLEQPALRFQYPRLLRSVADAARTLEARSNAVPKEKVISLYEKYLETNEDAAAHQWLGQLYRETNRDEEAIDHFMRAWEMEPRNASPYKAALNLFREQGKMSQIEEAKKLWRLRNPKRA